MDFIVNELPHPFQFPFRLLHLLISILQYRSSREESIIIRRANYLFDEDIPFCSY